MSNWAESVATAALEAPSKLEGAVTLQPHQKIPAHFDGGWLLLAGRGAGKTMAAMHWLNQRCEEEKGLRARVIAPTLGDGVASCVEGVDGLLELSHHRARFNPSATGGAVVTYPNGSRVWIVGTHKPESVDRLRALTNIEIDVFEEAAANLQLDAAVKQAALSRRRGRVRWIATTTPRPHPVLKAWVKDPKVHTVRAKMADNPFLPEAYREHAEQMKGTRLYRQEVLGEIIDDVEGALWTQLNVERSRLTAEDPLPEFTKIVVGVDPAVGSGTTGIVVVGIHDGVVYVLEDASQTDVQPSAWAAEVVRVFNYWGAAEVVVEDNQGGRLVTETLKTADISLPIREVTSRVSKEARATPVAVLWEVKDQRARMVGEHAELETQMLEWIPGTYSPDRIDAMVHAVNHLRNVRPGVVEIQSGVKEQVVDLAGFRKMRMTG